MSNYKLFPTMYISHIAQYLELKNIIQTSAFKHITIYLEKKRIVTQRSHIVTRWLLQPVPKILDTYMCERRGRKTQKHVQAPVSCLTVSLEFTGPCGDFTVMIVIKKIFAEFQLAPSEAARWNDAARGRDGF